MFEVKPMINPTRLVLLCSAWLAALIQVVFGSSAHALVDIGVMGYAGFVLLTLSRLRRETILILLLLVLVGWFLLDHRPSPDEWRAAGRYVLIFTALLPTMALVRATASTMPSVRRTQQALAQLPASASASGFHLAANIFGSIIFNALTGNHDDYWPEPLRDEIESVNQDIYDNINNGVYKAGFATSAAAYEDAVRAVFAALDRMELRLQQGRYLMGSQLTEADWRFFTTLVRFDPVYVGHFKCNLRRIADYPALTGYLRDLYQTPGIAETVVMDHIKQHYYQSHRQINPTILNS